MARQARLVPFQFVATFRASRAEQEAHLQHRHENEQSAVDASTVTTRGVRIPIGDVSSVHARILLAVRYLEVKEGFRF